MGSMATEIRTAGHQALVALRREVNRTVCWGVARDCLNRERCGAGDAASNLERPVAAILARVIAARSRRCGMCEGCTRAAECREMLDARTTD